LIHIILIKSSYYSPVRSLGVGLSVGGGKFEDVGVVGGTFTCGGDDFFEEISFTVDFTALTVLFNKVVICFNNVGMLFSYKNRAR